MTQRKQRLTVTVDHALVKAADEAVATGRAASLSGWVNLALAERAAKERKLKAMADALSAYEAEFGVISDAELREQERVDRRAAVLARANASTPRGTKRRRAA